MVLCRAREGETRCHRRASDGSASRNRPCWIDWLCAKPLSDIPLLGGQHPCLSPSPFSRALVSFQSFIVVGGVSWLAKIAAACEPRRARGARSPRWHHAPPDHLRVRPRQMDGWIRWLPTRRPRPVLELAS
uniref:Uncharacterized protein n=1 Tax=Setaria italica TaxID=4555 RepID=K4AGK5_SETIT